MTDTEANKALVKRYFTAIEQGDPTAFDEVVSTDYQDHAPGASPEGKRSRRPSRPSVSPFPT
jgi:ketosteroid isomerase-like protein